MLNIKSKIKILFLTAGRSDYSIYLPLLKKISLDNRFDVRVVAFGSHPYEEFGNTIGSIIADGFKVSSVVKALESDFSQKSIVIGMSNTMREFASIYEREDFDLVFALGDRFEMFAAVAASIPFNIPIAHIHGGERTLGAMDEKFRHSITLMSKYHFTSTKNHAKKVINLIESDEFVYNVGALALDNIREMELLSLNELNEELHIDFRIPTLLATIHPETVNLSVNLKLADEFVKAIDSFGFQTLITMPNNDTFSNVLKDKLIDFKKKNDRVFIVDCLGPLKYYSCMKYCYAVIGNSSSGIVEAASFRKYVINIGDRQKGRDRGENIIDVPIDSTIIRNKTDQIGDLSPISNQNIYGDGETADRIIKIISNNFMKLSGN